MIQYRKPRMAIAEFTKAGKVFATLNIDITGAEVTVGMKVTLAPVQLENQKITYELQPAA